MDKEKITKLLMKFEPKRENVIKALHELQDNHPQHYISKEIMDETAKYFKLTKGQIYGIASYYSMFSLKPRGKYIIRVCHSPVCSMMGSQNLIKHIENICGISLGETTKDGLFTIEHTECLGRCDKAPSMMINENVYTDLTVEKIDEILNDLKNER
ncbi:MAG: NADH-quinone oxidoreductase subunit NuoE [Bacteroidales bacterium]